MPLYRGYQENYNKRLFQDILGYSLWVLNLDILLDSKMLHDLFLTTYQKKIFFIYETTEQTEHSKNALDKPPAKRLARTKEKQNWPKYKQFNGLKNIPTFLLKRNASGKEHRCLVLNDSPKYMHFEHFQSKILRLCIYSGINFLVAWINFLMETILF